MRDKLKKLVDKYSIKLINHDRDLDCKITPKDDELKFFMENKLEVIEFLKKKERDSLPTNEFKISEEIEKLEGGSGAVVALVIAGIFGIIFYIIPGIILFAIAALVSSSRKSKAASLRIQLESLQHVKKSTKSQLETKKEEDPLKIIKKRFAEGTITEEEYIKKKKILKKE